MVLLYKERNGVPCHEYFDEEFWWIEYVSVSKIKGGYKKFFDGKAVAARCSTKPRSEWYGMTVPEILKAWREMKEEGLAIGSKIHEVVERYFVHHRHEDFEPRDDFEDKIAWEFNTLRTRYGLAPENVTAEKAVHIDVVDFWGRSVARWNNAPMEELEAAVRMTGRWDIYAEKRSWVAKKHWRYIAIKCVTAKGLAGTPDIVQDRTNYFDIHDIKTDKKIRAFAYKEADGQPEKMLFPVQHLQNCNYEEYMLQVWCYALMIERMTGKRFRAGFIQHFNKETHRLSQLIIYDRRQEVRMILQHFFGIGAFQTMPA